MNTERKKVRLEYILINVHRILDQNSIDEAIYVLQKFKEELDCSGVLYNNYFEYDEMEEEFYIETYRYENDEEYNERLEAEAKEEERIRIRNENYKRKQEEKALIRNQRLEEEERATLKRLKEKYGE